VKTEDSGHFEDSGSTSSLDDKSLEKQKRSSSGGGGDSAGQKINMRCAQLPRKSEQLPPHRKLSLNDYMAFDPISRYLLQNPSLV